MTKKTSILSISILLVVVIIGVIVLISIQKSSKKPSIYRTGMVEMTEINVAAKIAGRIDSITVDEGDAVVKGQFLFRMSSKEILAKEGQAQGAIYSAKAQWNMSLAGTRPEQIAMAERNFNAVRTQFDLAEKTYKRMKALHSDSLLSDQDFDGITQKYNAAHEAMEAAEAQFAMAKKGAREEEKEMAKGQYDRAIQSLNEVKAYLDETAMVSPINGIISKKYTNCGELAAAGYPVLSIIDTSNTWIELNLPENELKWTPIGGILRAFIPSLSRYEDFKVTSYSSMADYANWRSQNERGTFEIRTFTVKLKPLNKIPELRPGMTVNFEIKNS